MKAMNFQDDVPSIPFDNPKNQNVPEFDLTSMQDATENCHYPELVGETLSLQLNSTFPLKHVTELIALENEFFPLQLTSLLLLEKNRKWTMFLPGKQSIVTRYSSIGTLVHLPHTMFQPLIATLLP